MAEDVVHRDTVIKAASDSGDEGPQTRGEARAAARATEQTPTARVGGAGFPFPDYRSCSTTPEPSSPPPRPSSAGSPNAIPPSASSPIFRSNYQRPTSINGAPVHARLASGNAQGSPLPGNSDLRAVTSRETRTSSRASVYSLSGSGATTAAPSGGLWGHASRGHTASPSLSGLSGTGSVGSSSRAPTVRERNKKLVVATVPTWAKHEPPSPDEPWFPPSATTTLASRPTRSSTTITTKERKGSSSEKAPSAVASVIHSDEGSGNVTEPAKSGWSRGIRWDPRPGGAGVGGGNGNQVEASPPAGSGDEEEGSRWWTFTLPHKYRARLLEHHHRMQNGSAPAGDSNQATTTTTTTTEGDRGADLEKRRVSFIGDSVPETGPSPPLSQMFADELDAGKQPLSMSMSVKAAGPFSVPPDLRTPAFTRHLPNTPGWDSPWRAESRSLQEDNGSDSEGDVDSNGQRVAGGKSGGLGVSEKRRRGVAKKGKRGSSGRHRASSGSASRAVRRRVLGQGRWGMFEVDAFGHPHPVHHEDGLFDPHGRPAPTASWSERWRAFLLYNPFAPLLFRILNIAFTVVTLVLAVRIHLFLTRHGAAGLLGSSPVLAIVFAPLTLVHVAAQVYLEYFGRPIGLWGVRAKLFYTLTELVFICVWSAELSLAFDNYFTSPINCVPSTLLHTWGPPVSANGTKWNGNIEGSVADRVCTEQAVLIGLVFVGLVLYIVVMTVSLFRIFARVSRRS